MLHQQNALLLAQFILFLRPDAGLNFADVRFLKQEHTQAALSYTATYRVGQLSIHKRLMEAKLQTVLAAASGKLSTQRLLAHAYTHR